MARVISYCTGFDFVYDFASVFPLFIIRSFVEQSVTDVPLYDSPGISFAINLSERVDDLLSLRLTDPVNCQEFRSLTNPTFSFVFVTFNFEHPETLDR